MRISIGFFGFHYFEHYKLRNTNINYKDSIDNYKKYIFDAFMCQTYENNIDTFFSTYNSNNTIETQLIKNYCPKKYIFLKYNEKFHRHNAKNTHVINLCNIILNYEKQNKIKYDICILTRFDLLFNIELTKLNIKYNKINVACKFSTKIPNKYIIDDNFYIVPGILIKKFANIFKNNIKTVAHKFSKYFLVYGLNYLTNGIYINTTDIPFFKINRNLIKNTS